MHYKVGAVQIKMKELDLMYNLSTLEKYVRLAAKDGAKLILLPETCNLGSLCTTREAILPYAEPIPGKSTEFLSELCKELDVAIAFGMIEHDLNTDLVFNSVAFIDRNGKIVGTYRKTHLFSTETNFLVPGNTGIPVFDTEFGKIGILICEDTVHFETSRLLALKGIDILLMSTCWVDNGPDDAWRARAAENGIYMICADWWNTNSEGVDYGGGSCIIDPQGNVLCKIGMGDGCVVSEIETNQICRDTILAGRQKSKYHWLLQDSYLWGNGGQNLPEPVTSKHLILAYNAQTLEEYKSRLAENLQNALSKEIKLVVLPACYQKFGENVVAEIQGFVPDCSAEVLFVISYIKNQAKVTVLFKKHEILKTYQSIHHMPGEGSPGSSDVFSTIDTVFGRIGLLSDDDIFYPEAVRCLVRKGADAICVSGNWDRQKMFILNERRLFSDCAILASCRDAEGAYCYFGAPYALETEEKTGVLVAELDTGNDFIRNKIDIRKARIDLYEGLITY